MLDVRGALLRPAAPVPDAAPRSARADRRLRRLPLVLQPGRDRNVGLARVPGVRLPARAHALSRASDRAARASRWCRWPGGPAGGGNRAARRVPDRPRAGDREGRRRRLRQRCRRDARPGRQGALQGQRRRRPALRHLRAGQLPRLRSVRQGLPPVATGDRDAGRLRAAGCARGDDRLRPAHDRGPLRARPAAAQGPRRPDARHRARLRMGRVPVHDVPADEQHE